MDEAKTRKFLVKFLNAQLAVDDAAAKPRSHAFIEAVAARDALAAVASDVFGWTAVPHVWVRQVREVIADHGTVRPGYTSSESRRAWYAAVMDDLLQLTK